MLWGMFQAMWAALGQDVSVTVAFLVITLFACELCELIHDVLHHG
jgi:hypothetical protein